MCGIVARVGDGDAVDTLLEGLQNLEYRGYDSAGVCVTDGDSVSVVKRAGQVADLDVALSEASPTGSVGIGHTRWATHGPPSDANAHPHTDDDERVAVVHNGVVENHDELRERLGERDHEFTSATDTEVVPHLVAEYLTDRDDAEAAFRAAVADLEGSYALAAVVEGENAVYAARRGSPLVLGLADDAYFLASDVPAFLDYTDRVVYLDDDEVAVVRPDGIAVTDLDGTPQSHSPTTVDWDPEETGKGDYRHYMLKEIHAQPTALANTVDGRVDPATGEVDLDGFPPGTFEDVETVQLVACGTSYHATLYGERLLASAGVRARAFRASEYADSADPVTESTLVVGVTQSGETADTLSALRAAKEDGAKTATVTNVVGSSAARLADDAMFIRAGPEIGVAATKTFSSQAVSLTLLAHRIAEDVPGATPREDAAELFDGLDGISDQVSDVLANSDAERVARRYGGSDAFFFIGRGLGYPVALEGALKFKEITYEHAEGFAAGELKHGPLALVTPNTPVFAIFDGTNDEKTLTNAEEAQTRGADVVAIAPDDHPAADVADTHLSVPDVHPAWSSLLANVHLQLLSYHAADRLDRAIDKPRNLAKSVTVE